MGYPVREVRGARPVGPRQRCLRRRLERSTRSDWLRHGIHSPCIAFATSRQAVTRGSGSRVRWRQAGRRGELTCKDSQLAESVHTHLTFQNGLSLKRCAATRRPRRCVHDRRPRQIKTGASFGALCHSISATHIQGRTVPTRQPFRRALGSDSGREAVRALG